jgi:hypothetical protein
MIESKGAGTNVALTCSLCRVMGTHQRLLLKYEITLAKSRFGVYSFAFAISFQSNFHGNAQATCYLRPPQKEVLSCQPPGSRTVTQQAYLLIVISKEALCGLLQQFHALHGEHTIRG